MGKILQAFADGELYVTEIVQKRTPEHQKLIEKNLQLYNQLLQKLIGFFNLVFGELNEEEKEIFQNLLNVISDENYYDTQNNFIRGYCLGALMTMEILSEQNSFL